MGLIKPIAIYLPQFHPIPENDIWWGKGFTEWRNVTKAKPLFKGHYQPHLPADLGFYDLRLIDTMKEQAELAHQYRIYGFCFYHYWFNGKRILEKPIDHWIQSKINFPFMICWANENWTRTWDGSENEILLQQTYSEADDIEHIRFLSQHILHKSNYIRVNGKPFLLIYRPSLFPNIQKTLTTWRSIAQQEGIGDLFIGYMQSFGLKVPPTSLGFDCAVDFQPNFYQPLQRNWGTVWQRILHKLKVLESPFQKHFVYRYADLVQKSVQTALPDEVYPCIVPGWDNSARKKTGARIFQDSTPTLFTQWAQFKLQQLQQRNHAEDFLFINAWNEWAEGNHLEPCLKWGTQYLEQLKKVLDGNDG